MCWCTRYVACGNEIYIISKPSIARLYRILREQNISNEQCEYIDKGENIMENNKNILREETINFAIEISDICDNIKGSSVYVNQLLRCSSSIGANLHEAKYAQSRADIINKLEIIYNIDLEEVIKAKCRISETKYTSSIAFEEGR
ncbi:MAG: four helix bundle protein [Ruminococcaceae bacterium]|nr:four helix bundle protein [Oscillospiraceae bacterium]